MLDISNDLDQVYVPDRDDEGRRVDGGGGDGGGLTEKPAREGRLDLRNGWQVVAGSILIPLGVVLIMIGWYGAAHARVVQQQIPYLVSGSFVGLGCMVVGGLSSGDTGSTGCTTRRICTMRSNSACSR